MFSISLSLFLTAFLSPLPVSFTHSTLSSSGNLIFNYALPAKKCDCQSKIAVSIITQTVACGILHTSMPPCVLPPCLLWPRPFFCCTQADQGPQETRFGSWSSFCSARNCLSGSLASCFSLVVAVAVIACDILKSQLPNLPFFKAPLTPLCRPPSSRSAGDNSMTSHN